ncbi:hypothetical protein [Schlesneria paludicola]|uniref:hypothetical protein n=1 Tax=Schlesneria paludicola TaxID=360056 RepID=UPI00029A27AB|nr:hypothetical protein [Schlesneria paludicola]
MSRRSKETLAVQLFPFLAVLVCTMGSLIFLLLVTTRQVRQRTIAYAKHEAEQKELARVAAQRLPELSIPLPPAEEKPPEPAIVVPPPRREPKPFREPDRTYELALANRQRELEQLKAEWASRADQLSKDRDRHRTVLAHRQTAVDAAVIEAEALKAEIKRLEIELGKLAGTAAASSFSSTEAADRLLIEQQIAEMKKRLRAAQAEEASGENDKFQVIPFDPQTGTTRRPIFIECNATGLRFLPEDITITAADLNGFTPRANPLAAGTGALINYWTAWNSQQRDRKSAPEPYVLLLVRPDGAVAYYVAQRMLDPIHTARGYELIEADTTLQMPAADAGAKAACQAAVERLLMERENISRSAVNQGTGSSVYGGTARYGKPGSGGGNPGGSTQGQLAGKAPGSRGNGESGGSFSMSDLTGDEKEVGTRSWERVENFEGRPKHRRGQELERNLDDVQNRLAQGGGSQNFGGAGADEPSDPDQSPESSEGRPTGKSAKGGVSSGRKGGFKTHSGSAPSNESGESDPDGMVEHEPGMPIGKRPNSKRGQPRSLSDGSGPSRADANSNQGENDDSADTSGMDADSTPTDSPDSSSRRVGSSAPRSARGKQRLQLGDGKSGGKSKEIDDKQIEPEMLAGRRWGHCDPGASIGFERDVTVEVFEDHFTIAEKYEIRVEEGETKQEIFENFVTSVDRYTREWGKPPQGFFWTPRLKFVVKPDANGRYEQINGLMTRAGLSTSHEFAKTNNTVEFGREKPASIKSVPKTASQHGTGGVR